MAAYPIMWSSDIKSNVTNELPDSENLSISSMWFYFDELESIFVSGTVKFFKIAAKFGYHHITLSPNKKSDAANGFSDIKNFSLKRLRKNSCVFMNFFGSS